MKDNRLLAPEWRLETLVAPPHINDWIRTIVRYLRFTALGLVLLFVWLPDFDKPDSWKVLLWLVVNLFYVLGLEMARRFRPAAYEATLFRATRNQVDVLSVAILLIAAPQEASSYIWLFFTIALLSAIGYASDLRLPVLVYAEASLAMAAATLAREPPTLMSFATGLAESAFLGWIGVALYFTLKLLPQAKSVTSLSDATTSLLKALDQRSIAQLLADTARQGIPTADAAVVHIVRADQERTLEAVASSNIDPTTLGTSPMRVGLGIAGRAVETHQTINSGDVHGDDRFHKLPASYSPFTSLLSAPMYVGNKDIGSISVHSLRGRAFDETHEHFLTALAAQGATALANIELWQYRERRRSQLSNILDASLRFRFDQPLADLLHDIAGAISECSAFRMVALDLVAPDDTLEIAAVFGLPPDGELKLKGKRFPHQLIRHLLTDEFRVGRSYFIRHDRCQKSPDLADYSYTPELGDRMPGEWHQEDMLIVPMRTPQEQLLGYISVDDPIDRSLPSLDVILALEVLATVAATTIQNARLLASLQVERQRDQRVARLLHLLHRVGLECQELADLDTMLHIVLTGITARYGLRFNRAAVFLLDSKREALIGRLGIGQTCDEDARATWERIEREDESFDDYAKAIRRDGISEWTPFHERIKGLVIPVAPGAKDALSQAVFCDKPQSVVATDDESINQAFAAAVEPTSPYVIFPLVGRDVALGVLVCDNKFTGEPVTADLDLLGAFANQAAAAIEGARYVEQMIFMQRAREREEATRAERARLEDGLHDAMSVLTTRAKWETEILIEGLDKSDLAEAREAAGNVQAALSRGCTDLRNLLEDIHDRVFETQGLLPALRS